MTQAGPMLSSAWAHSATVTSVIWTALQSQAWHHPLPVFSNFKTDVSPTSEQSQASIARLRLRSAKSKQHFQSQASAKPRNVLSCKWPSFCLNASL